MVLSSNGQLCGNVQALSYFVEGMSPEVCLARDHIVVLREPHESLGHLNLSLDANVHFAS